MSRCLKKCTDQNFFIKDLTLVGSDAKSVSTLILQRLEALHPKLLPRRTPHISWLNLQIVLQQLLQNLNLQTDADHLPSPCKGTPFPLVPFVHAFPGSLQDFHRELTTGALRCNLYNIKVLRAVHENWRHSLLYTKLHRAPIICRQI